MTYVSCFVAMLGQFVETDLFMYFFALLFIGLCFPLLSAFMGVFSDGN